MIVVQEFQAHPYISNETYAASCATVWYFVLSDSNFYKKQVTSHHFFSTRELFNFTRVPANLLIFCQHHFPDWREWLINHDSYLLNEVIPYKIPPVEEEE